MKRFLLILGAVCILSAAGAAEKLPGSAYIDLMEKVLSAYSDGEIDRYYNQVRTGGLKEHGFPRLTANIGILIAHGKRSELKEKFRMMMDLCCQEIPKRKKAGNEFSIKEVIFALMEVEKKGIFSREQIESWKNSLKQVKVENCYRVYAKAPDSKVRNWAAFAMVSEWMRYHIKAAPADMRFIENQAASQWQWVDENGMYRDPHEPMVYDLVTRGLFAVLLHFGYRGEYFEKWDNALKKSGLLTLKMISVSGGIPYGGRSNQFLHNEAQCAIVCEYEAARYARMGDMKTAATFRGAAKMALENMESWLAMRPISHVKNAFPRESRYGCERYAYFDKYMITAASFLYAAYLLCDEKIPAEYPDSVTGESWQSSDHFHKLFLRAGDYAAEYDYRADYAYDASGMGRVHRKGAPEVICLSTPGTHKPRFAVDLKGCEPFAIAPQLFCNGLWLSGADPAAQHKVEKHSARGAEASAHISCSWPGKGSVQSFWNLDKDGLRITVKGKGTVGLMIPVFAFDGREKSLINHSGKSLTVTWRNWICRWQLKEGKILDTGKSSCNRNGHYKLFRVENSDELTVTVSIEPVR